MYLLVACSPEGGLRSTSSEPVAALVRGVSDGRLDPHALNQLVATGDKRWGWFVADLLRIFEQSDDGPTLINAFNQLTGAEVTDERSAWVDAVDWMITDDAPAPDGYVTAKQALFAMIEPKWKAFFDDRDATVDWRWIGWGGVKLDDRPLGDPEPCPSGCIPALDDPTLVTDGTWYGDNQFIFGVEVNGDAVAFPKNIMEVHEMVNVTIGSRRLGIPYCTLCGSAQAFLTDVGSGKPLVLRTSGLLSRSNKVMFELKTRSMFDTFTGRGLSGELQGTTLQQTTVVVSTWGDWRAAHPTTRIVAQDGGVGRSYDDNPLGNRDTNGPIFPTGPRDPRLAVHTKVVGVVLPNGATVAFPVERARQALRAGNRVELGGVVLKPSGGGLVAETTTGRALAAFESFWFAWSQFHPTTQLWTD